MRNTVNRLLAVGVMSALMALFAVPQPAMAAVRSCVPPGGDRHCGDLVYTDGLGPR